jgi:acetyl-CoA C-acetyltransferase
MALDARTPVIVGVGQLNQRTDQPEDALEPVDLMVEAARGAARDSGVAALLDAVTTVRVVNLLSWRYRDPGALVAERLGIPGAQTVYTEGGGQIVGTLVALTAADIVAGHVDVALLTGAEAWKTRTAVKRAGDKPRWTEQPDGVAPDEVVGGALDMWHPAELARNIRMPVQVYPLFENAVRAAAGRDIADHTRHLGRLWARFSDVAVSNPHAWDPTRHTAEEISTPAAGNRMVGFPYTKLLCSNERVDQGAAVIMCSAERAAAAGVPRDRWVFPHAIVEARAPSVSERIDLSSSTMVRAAGEALWKLLGRDADDVAHVDLYSCFPSAVEVQAAELGFGLDRTLTVTGGMRFAGGPWNNYPMHALAALVDVLRADPGARGLLSANGGYVTKLAVGVFSTEPPASGFGHASPQASLDAEPRRGVELEPDGVATVETYTVMHDRGGEPTEGIVACTMPDGRRAWGVVHGGDELVAMTRDEMIGRGVTLRPDGAATIS